MRSIRARLLAGTLVGSSALMSALGVGLYYSIRSVLDADFDETLTAKARALAALVEEEDGEIEAEFAEYPSSDFSRQSRPEYYLLRKAGGPVIACSPSLGVTGLGPTAGGPDSVYVAETLLPDGRPGRLAVLPFDARSEGRRKSRVPLVLVLARDTLDLQHTLGRLRLLLLAIGGAGVTAMCGLMWAAVRAGLRPLRSVAGQIESLDAARLSQRLSPQGVPLELVPVINCLNDLLQRLQDAFTRERLFTADVAHDLRTPLAGLRSTLEVALRRERTAAEYLDAITESLAVTQDTQAMMDNLLALARAEAGQIPIERKPIDLEPLLRTAWTPFAERAGSRDLQVQWQVPPHCVAVTDPGQLGLVLRNLFDNAVTYANTGGDIRVDCATGGSPANVSSPLAFVQLRVTNTGSRLSIDDVEHVFERFWRGDKSRTDTGLHCGLGLSLSKRIIELLGGTILASVSNGEFTVCLRLPSDNAQPA